MTLQRYIGLSFCCLSVAVFGQTDQTLEEKIVIDGQVVTALVQNGDTLILAELDEATVTSFQSFSFS